MDVFIVDAIQEVNGQTYAASRSDDGEMYVVQVDALELEVGACSLGEVMLDVTPIPITEFAVEVQKTFGE